MGKFLQITTAIGSQGEADRIAAALIERRLAGCVQIVGPVKSVYRWQGAVEHAEEWLCLVKTSADHYPAVEAAIRELHSYECPEIIATPIEAMAPAYREWLDAQLGQSNARRDQP